MTVCSQLSLADVYKNCQDLMFSDKPISFSLLEKHLDFSGFIPINFYNAYYLGRNRIYPLSAFIASLIFQKVATIPTDSQLILLLNICKELRDFCDFNLKTVIHQLKAFHKSLGDNAKFNPYDKAYSSMPSQAASNQEVKQLHINGHFCYAHKFIIITNALGIVHHITFLDNDFKKLHTELIIEKKSDSPEEDKSFGDSSALQPVLNDFFGLHQDFHPHTFLGDAAFDKLDHYKILHDTCGFQKVLIPLNTRNSSSLPKVGYNELGYLLCPNYPDQAIKYAGTTNERGRSNRIKWCCPKVYMVNGQWLCDYGNPCSDAKLGRTTYINDSSILRNYPGLERSTIEWDIQYKKRTVVEQTIQHLKDNMCISNRKTSNLKTTKADVFLAGIASLFTVILADRINSQNTYKA